ncbi:hypothetical protein N431DRAFT_544550 [Stipitochalara longipes BDJ]|nr:hypothetical protein N431DRAFT_544550 [Stipitochalara longipes BDJ]
METVNNLASAASRAIWGEGAANGAQSKENETNGQEPLSGETGNVEAGEPYDKGNAEPTPTHSEPKPTVGEPASTASSSATEEPKISTLTSNPKVTDTTATNTTDNKPSSAEPVTADLSSAPQNTQKQQGADRPAAEPSSEEHDRIKETKKQAEEAAAIDTSGPGPKSLEEKARDNGGAVDAGGKTEGEGDGPQKESHGEGTGEKYVKSSGVKADGGDFDAANPGAGREADRLLEEKGIHHELGAGGSPASTEEVGGKDEKAGKTKLRDKIKEKLHIGHKDKD